MQCAKQYDSGVHGLYDTCANCSAHSWRRCVQAVTHLNSRQSSVLGSVDDAGVSCSLAFIGCLPVEGCASLESPVLSSASPASLWQAGVRLRFLSKLMCLCTAGLQDARLRPICKLLQTAHSLPESRQASGTSAAGLAQFRQASFVAIYATGQSSMHTEPPQINVQIWCKLTEPVSAVGSYSCDDQDDRR